MPVNPSSDDPGPFSFVLSRRAALAVLMGLGAVLAGIVLYDIYADWVLEGKLFWSTLVENALPLVLSLSIPAGGAWLARSYEEDAYLSAAATWAVLGGALTLIIAGIILGFQVVQQEIKPFVFVSQMMTAGAFAGLLVGYLIVEIRQYQQSLEDVSGEDVSGENVSGKDVSARATGGAVPTPLNRMRLRKQVGLALLAGVGLALASTTLHDIYADWVLEGKPLWSTLVENSIPLFLALAVPGAGWRLARRGALYVSEAAKWTVASTLGMLIVAGAVLGLQVIQGALKPGVILTQLSTFGAVAGLFVGYTVARARRIRRRLVRRRESLRDREARIRGLANSVPGAVFQFEVLSSGEQTFTFVSEQTETRLGISSEPEGYFERFVQQVPPSHREGLLESIEEAVQEGREWSYEMPFDRPDGERIWVRGISTPERRQTPEGEKLIYHGVTIDITERVKREREARRRSEAIAGAIDGIAILGPDGTYEYVNQAHAEIYGYESPEAMIGESWKICYSGEELQRFETEVMPRLEEKGEWRGEATGRRKGGEPFPQEVSLTSLEDGGLVCVVRDITDRKRRTRELRQRGAALQQAGESVLITEAEPLEKPGPRITYVNEAFEEMTGYSEEEIVGKTPRILQGPKTDPEVIDGLRQALKAGEEWEGETVNYRKDGTPYIVNWDVTPVRVESGEIQRWVSTQRDVTEKRRREKALREAKEEAEKAKEAAEEASRLKSAMLANMSHEIRTPLTSIIGFAEALGREAKAKEAEAKETEAEEAKTEKGDTARFAGLIEKSGRRLKRTLTGLLDLSKLEAGQMELGAGPADLAAVAQSVTREMAPQSKEAEVDIEVEAPGAPTWARADERGVEMALSNLLSNAIKYTEPGGEVRVRAYREGDSAVLEVEDTGVGMEPEEIDRLFDAFEQESEGLGREYEGTGLGLSIVEELVGQMGGTIEVESEKGEGSRFILRLPVADALQGRPDGSEGGEARPQSEAGGASP